MPRLRYLDLGHGDEDALQVFWDYCVSQAAIGTFAEKFPGVELSMAEKRLTPLPHPFPGGDHEHETAFFAVVDRLGESDDDPAIRAAAREYLAQLPIDEPDIADLNLDDDDDDDDDDTYFLRDDENDGDSDSS